MQIVDTDVLIDVQRGHQPAIDWFSSLVDLPGVTGFSIMELIQDAADLRSVKATTALVDGLPVFWPSATDCQAALDSFKRFHVSHRLGLLDALIAYTAIGVGAELCTFNTKHFKVVPNLTLVRPYGR